MRAAVSLPSLSSLSLFLPLSSTIFHRRKKTANRKTDRLLSLSPRPPGFCPGGAGPRGGGRPCGSRAGGKGFEGDGEREEVERVEVERRSECERPFSVKEKVASKREEAVQAAHAFSLFGLTCGASLATPRTCE